MLKIGDTVKVISKTNDDGELIEYFPLGTICNVVEVRYDINRKPFYGISPVNDTSKESYYYWENELEKGHIEWIKD